jgi:extracellular factor (EF) 3-hydroxypalmitic acid methyl ester biosynthesis protein
VQVLDPAAGGGAGNNILFRPERFRARELIPGEPLRIEVNGRRFLLEDVAVAGLAFKMPQKDAPLVQGAPVEIRVLLRREPVYEGRAKVVRVESPPGRAHRVALELLEGFIDLPSVRELDATQRFKALLHTGASARREAVPAPYRALIGDMVHFLSTWGEALANRTRAIVQSETEVEARLRTLSQEVFESVVGEWRALSDQGGALAERLATSPDRREAMKRYTETMLTQRVLDAPLVHQAFEKPLGYPGDYRTMHQIYGNQLVGPTPMAAVVQGLLCDDRMSRGVRSRKDHLKAALERAIAEHGGRPVRILSLGCGPAREVSELVESMDPAGPAVEWVLVDQEIDALRDAHGSTLRALKRQQGRGKVRCLHLSFGQMVADPELGTRDETFDIIYTSGLADYLHHDKASQMVAMLLGKVAPQGHLIVANALSPSTWSWACEYLLDWHLVYRTHDDLRALVGSSAPVATAKVDEEPEGVFGFLHLRKP